MRFSGVPLLERLAARGRIVLLAVAAAMPMMVFAGYLLADFHPVAGKAVVYGLTALAAVVLVVLVAWYGAERLVLGPVRLMLEVTRRVSAGDLDARTGMRPSHEELSQLGSALDAMAARLETRDRELRQALTDLHKQAMTDSLTGLYNRRFFWDALTREFSEARRKQAPFCVILLDIDHFKRVNDKWGHDAGDRVLGSIGELIEHAIRESDIAARHGGEEFAILLPDTGAAVAAERAEDLRQQISELSVPVDNGAIRVTASFGVTQATVDIQDAASLMKAVDAAMYAAKSGGRNRVIVTSTQASQASECSRASRPSLTDVRP